jgi:hypothetical protein
MNQITLKDAFVKRYKIGSIESFSKVELSWYFLPVVKFTINNDNSI